MTVADSAAEQASGYPRAWRFDEDGEAVSGEFVSITQGLAGGSPCPILNLKTADGETRAVWLFHMTVRAKFAEEIARRPSGDFTAGERITVRRGEMKESASTGRQYRNYAVEFEAAAKRSAKDILGAPVATDVDVRDDEARDDIPF